MRRTTKWMTLPGTLLLITASLGLTLTISAPSAFACDFQHDPNCVGVGAGDPGEPATASPPGRTAVTYVSGATTPDPCAKYPAGYYEECTASTGGGCLDLYDQYFGTMPLADFNTLVDANGCPSVGAAAKPPPTPAELAVQAAASFRLPMPSGHRSPSEGQDVNGYSITYVNLWTFYWTDPGTWKSLTATASAGGNYATVTATPVSLTFDPGDGSSPSSCAGPGRPWQQSDGSDPPSDGACGFQYLHITGSGYDHPVTSTQTIAWQLTWTGSNNTNGTLTKRTTATNGPLNVLQIQTVNN